MNDKKTEIGTLGKLGLMDAAMSASWGVVVASFFFSMIIGEWFLTAGVAAVAILTGISTWNEIKTTRRLCDMAEQIMNDQQALIERLNQEANRG